MLRCTHRLCKCEVVACSWQCDGNGCAVLCCAGFFIPYASMPKWWSWFYWLNPLSYMIQGVITS